MREHVRGNGRYFRTEAGNLVLDWGSNGADYKTLDFSYVAKGKWGNLHKLYGQVRRSDDGETYATYNTKAGRYRQVVSGKSSIATAIKAHIEELTGEDAKIEVNLPPVPNTIREEMSAVIMKAIKGWDFCWRGESKQWDEAAKQRAREAFVAKTWDCGNFYCETLASKKAVAPVGLLNVGIGDYSNLYRLWRSSCEAVEKV